MPAGFVAGVDIGASNVRVAIANDDGEIEARRAGPMPAGSPQDAVERIGRTIDDLVRGVWVGAKVAAIGIALPGAVDPRSGTVASIANMPGWDNIPLAQLLGARRGVPVAVENDANAAAVGEGWLGGAKGLKDHVFIALGTGIGSGIVLGGKLVRGRHFLAGELGYVPMTREQLHTGGWDDCLEGIVGGRAAARIASELLGASANAGDLFSAARTGEPRASAWLAEVQDYIAIAVASVATLLDPEAIIFGGGIFAAQKESFLEPIRVSVLRCIPGKPKLLLSSMGEDAQLLGAVRLAYDKLAEAGA